MSRIEIIKTKVTPADAARKYGLPVQKNGMVFCPFHNDDEPSMKLYDDHFYCFACGAHGDVIDLTSKLLGLNFTETIHRLSVDFEIFPNDDPPAGALPPRPHIAQFRNDELLCLSTLTEYERLLRHWKRECDPGDDRFVEACQMLDAVECLADFLSTASLEERVKVVDELIQNGIIEKLRDRLEEVTGNERAA
jgi:hypothetical protein